MTFFVTRRSMLDIETAYGPFENYALALDYAWRIHDARYPKFNERRHIGDWLRLPPNFVIRSIEEPEKGIESAKFIYEETMDKLRADANRERGEQDD